VSLPSCGPQHPPDRSPSRAGHPHALVIRRVAAVTMLQVEGEEGYEEGVGITEGQHSERSIRRRQQNGMPRKGYSESG